MSAFLAATTKLGFVDFIIYSKRRKTLDCFGCQKSVGVNLELRDQSMFRYKRQVGNQDRQNRKRTIEKCSSGSGDMVKPSQSSTPLSANKCDGGKPKDFNKLHLTIHEFNVMGTRSIDSTEFIELKAYISDIGSIRSWGLQVSLSYRLNFYYVYFTKLFCFSICNRDIL